MRGLFPVTGEDVVAGFVLRSPFFFGLDSVLGELTDGRPLGREGGPALDVTDKIVPRADTPLGRDPRSEEHTSELQSLMRISYAVFCLKKKQNTQQSIRDHTSRANSYNKATI